MEGIQDEMGDGVVEGATGDVMGEGAVTDADEVASCDTGMPETRNVIVVFDALKS